MSDASQDALYAFVDEALAQGMSRSLMRKLHRIFTRKGLPLPADFEATLTEAGIIRLPGTTL